MEIVEKLRWWLVKLIAPRFTLCVEFRGSQHVERNVPVRPFIRLRVPITRKPDSGYVDYNGHQLSHTDVQAIINAGTAVEGSSCWPGIHPIDGDPRKGYEDAEGNPVEFSRDELTPERLSELGKAMQCDHDWQDDSAADKDPQVSMMAYGRTCKKCGAWEPTGAI